MLDPGSPRAGKQSNAVSVIPAGLPVELHRGCSGQPMVVLRLLPILEVHGEASGLV